jgi:hypothetical protein
MTEPQKVALFMLALDRLLHDHGLAEHRQKVLYIASNPEYDAKEPLAHVAKFFGILPHVLENWTLEGVLEPMPFQSTGFSPQPLAHASLDNQMPPLRLPTPAPHEPEVLDMDL